MEVTGRGVLVTGGASGIGSAVVRAFVAAGDVVVSLDRDVSAHATESVLGDVRDPQSHVAAVDATLRRAGGLDVLIVNAGIHDGGLGLELGVDEFSTRLQAVVDVNVLGYALALHAAAPHLTQSSGCVVMTSSDAGFLEGQTGAGIAYTSSKYAVNGMVRWAARTLAPMVRVNGVAPGGVLTNLAAVGHEGVPGARLFVDAEADGKRSAIAARTVLGTVLDADEVAALYVFLASPAARGFTGEILRPDGGLDLR